VGAIDNHLGDLVKQRVALDLDAGLGGLEVHLAFDLELLYSELDLGGPELHLDHACLSWLDRELSVLHREAFGRDGETVVARGHLELTTTLGGGDGFAVTGGEGGVQRGVVGPDHHDLHQRGQGQQVEVHRVAHQGRGRAVIPTHHRGL